MTLCDSSFFVALLGEGRSKRQHFNHILNNADKPLLVNWPCVTEAMHLLHKRGGGWRKQSVLLRMLMSSLIEVFELQSSDYEQLFALMERYQDRPMDFADASLVLAAEKTGERKILTLDSDFLFYRIHGKESFDIIKI